MYYELCVLIKDLGRRLPLQLQCIRYKPKMPKATIGGRGGGVSFEAFAFATARGRSREFDTSNLFRFFCGLKLSCYRYVCVLTRTEWHAKTTSLKDFCQRSVRYRVARASMIAHTQGKKRQHIITSIVTNIIITSIVTNIIIKSIVTKIIITSPLHHHNIIITSSQHHHNIIITSS